MLSNECTDSADPTCLAMRALMKSYVCECYIVSTLYRQSSAMINSPPWYYETLVWEYDKATYRHLGEGAWVEQVSSDGPRVAMNKHMALCRKYTRKAFRAQAAKEKKEADDDTG